MKVQTTNLPIDDLKKYGIIDSNNNFTKKLSETEVKSFLDGGTLIAENNQNSLTFKLTQDNKLDVNVYNKDIVNHKDLSSSEIFHILKTERNYYKTMADYGFISNIGQKEINNEKVAFVEIVNERGTSTFYGNDLVDKLKGFQVGDNVQIKQIGTSETELIANINGQNETIKKFDNIFSVEELNNKNKEFKSTLFEYDKDIKTIVALDVTKYDLKSVNGTTLTKEQLEKLKQGKEIKIDDETSIQLSPNAKNDANLLSSSKRLLIVTSFALDGGLSYMLLKGIQKLQRMQKEQKEQNEAKKYEVELEKMKSFLQSKSEQYPDNKKIINDLNIVSKELSNVKASNAHNVKNDKADDTVRLKVNDYDMYEDANREKENKAKREQENDQEQKQSFTRGRTR